VFDGKNDKGQRGAGERAEPNDGGATTNPATSASSSEILEEARQNRYNHVIFSLANRFFSRCSGAVESLAIAGLLYGLRTEVGGWLDREISDQEFLEACAGVPDDVKLLAFDRFKPFLTSHAAEFETLAAHIPDQSSPLFADLGELSRPVAGMLLSIRRCMISQVSLGQLYVEGVTALELVRRMDPSLCEQTKDFIRHMLHRDIDRLATIYEAKIAPEMFTRWHAEMRAKPCKFIVPSEALYHDGPGTLVSALLYGSKLLLSTGVLPAVIEEGRQSSPEAAVALFGLAARQVESALQTITKDRSSATSRLHSFVSQLPVSDRLTLLDILAKDPRATELSRRLESYGLMEPDVAFASWLIVHRERQVAGSAGPVSFIDSLVEQTLSRPGFRPALVALVSWSDQLATAELLDAALALTHKTRDTDEVVRRLNATGEELQRGASPQEARSILEHGCVPRNHDHISLPRSDSRITPPKKSTSLLTVLHERLFAEPDLQSWAAQVLEETAGQPEIRRSLRWLAAMPPALTPRLSAFLHEFSSAPRCAEFIASPRAFARLTDFLTAGRHEEIRELKSWLRGETDSDPIALPALRGRRSGGSAALEAAEAEDSGAESEQPQLILIPPGVYNRLVLMGGQYSPPKRAAIQEAAGDIPVLYLSPDDDPRSIRQTLVRGDLVVVNPTWNSHSATNRVLAQCRAQNITWIMLPRSGYQAVVHIAERIQH
jgi:hypothetical protein